MSKSVQCYFLIFLAVIVQSCSAFFTTETNYVKVNGTRFVLDGKPYYFAGTNLWYGCYLGSPGATGDRERLKRELDNLSAIGIKNLRILGASQQSTIGNSLKPAIQIEADRYNEDLLEGLDYLLYEMNKRNMHAVIFLNNYWEWSGGMSQYNAWFGYDKAADPGDPETSWHEFMEFSGKFYSNKAANKSFRNYIKMLITRKNKYSGYYYYEDPAIMAWQLSNEPRPGNSRDNEETITAYYKWIEETASLIKTLDPNHLVTAGNEGVWGSLEVEDIFVKAHKISAIDYCTFHIWPKNWGWYKADNAEETFPVTKKNVMQYFNDHMALSREIGKPITLEEFGLGRDLENYNPGTPTNYRDKYFEMLFEAVEDSAATGAPIAGTNFWTWGGEGRTLNENAMWKKGDPFTGDPPQEPQGLNSVFDSDTSTVTILKNHARKMNLLSEGTE